MLVTVAVLAVVAGCGKVSTSGPVDIDYWTGWSGHEFEIQQELVDEFNRTHPKIRVRLVSQFGNSGYQKVRIAFAGGATPDLMSTVWLDELASYSKRKVLEPLDTYMAQSGRSLDREFVPGLRKALRIDGKVYGLAVSTNTNFIVYNRDLFSRNGLDPNRIPKSMDELDSMADRCTKARPDGSYVHYGFRPGSLRSWVYSYGGSWFDEQSDRITANQRQNIDALRWMAGYGKRYDLKRIQSFQTTFGSETTPNGPFFVGKIAMWSTGEWSGEFLRRYAPDIDYGYFAWPCPPGGKPNSTVANGSAFVIPAACRHKKEAWEFLNWITSPKPVADFCSAIGNVPSLKSVANDPRFTKPLEAFAIRLSHNENAVSSPPIAIWPLYAREIDRVEENVTLGGKDPKTELDSLQLRMEREYQRSKQELGE
jgi:multiple sugar transport system substrate-binding protein